MQSTVINRFAECITFNSQLFCGITAMPTLIQELLSLRKNLRRKNLAISVPDTFRKKS
jgi:hypothetical protein